MSEPNGCPTPGACSAAAQTAELTKERNEWRSIATDNLSALQTATARIAAAQAREEKLRAALVEIRDGKFPKDGDEYADDSMRMFALAAIALPSDTSALDARLEQEREWCAKVCEEKKSNWNYCAAAIRGLK